MSMFNNGGGGFSGSQIGGGFVSNNNENFNNSNTTAAKRVIPYDQRCLSQVTIKQIKSAPPAHADDAFLVDDAEVGQLHMVARITGIDVQSSHTQYQLNDDTGILDAKQWSNDDQQAQGPNVQEGMWVHIFGRINTFQGKCSVNVFDLYPVTNFDEITHHFTEVVYAHLSNLEAAKKREMGGGMMGNDGMMMNTNNATSSMGPGYGNGQMGGGGGMNSNSGGGWNNNNGMSMGQDDGRSVIQQMVLKVVRSPEFVNSETGCNVQNIFQKLPNEDRNAIKDAIDMLAEEGVMYSTLDDEHYKAVE